ncbi:Protein of unknown function (DUF506 [Striga hermonthica]|uniref:Uncharacterized protein n=1 Tax=Striga hermonthica TaxID=68872 RepID=A0A9N7NG48_STRHE|nr:Protein of unknown function (DUF506 [Striga hermonthica]
MYGFTRTKSVTDPLDDKAKARIIRYEPGYVSSGSEHSAQADDDVTSLTLSELFYGFSEPKKDSDTDRDPPPMHDPSFVNADFTGTLVVDLADDDEFRIALEAHVLRALEVLPEVFVGRSEDLRRILKAMSGAARRSLKSDGLHLPPWRKYQYMRLKWLGPYRRTTNLLPTSFRAGARSFDAVHCRTVGFDAAANGGCAVASRAK